MNNTNETFTIRYRGDIIIVNVFYVEKDCRFLLQWPDNTTGTLSLNDDGQWIGDLPVGEPSELGQLIDAVLS